MGFKCPHCHKDFGNNKNNLKEHFIENPECRTESWILTDLFEKSLNIKRIKDKPIRRKYLHISEKHIFHKVNVISDYNGNDIVKCELCGLIAKRNGNSYHFDTRQINKIENCIELKK